MLVSLGKPTATSVLLSAEVLSLLGRGNTNVIYVPRLTLTSPESLLLST